MMTDIYSTKKFSDFYPNFEKFKEAEESAPFPKVITDDNLQILWGLLIARYTNNPIANMDENQFGVKVFSIIWQYGPSWEKEVEIQKELRNMSLDEMMIASKRINNHAYNPSSEPTTGTLEEIDYINDQSTEGVKRGKMESYSMILGLLKKDVSEEFIDRFRHLFMTITFPENPLLYETDKEEY